MIALGRWGSLAPFPPGEMRIGWTRRSLALKTLFDAEAAQGFHATVELRLDGQRFSVRVADGKLDVARGARVAGRRDRGAAGHAHRTALERMADAQGSGTVAVEGRKATLGRFLLLFPLPASSAEVASACSTRLASVCACWRCGTM